MDFIEILGLIAGGCTTLSFIPQIRKVIASRSAKDISFLMYTFYCTGLMLWTIYGFLVHSPSLIMANFGTLLLAFSILIMKFKFERAAQNRDQAST